PASVIYRDYELSELLEEKDAKLIATYRRAFSEGRVVSALHGDLDHKSLLEVLTDGELAEHVTQRERAALRGTVLWTRLVYPRRTTDERGRRCDLIDLLRKNRERFVLKPNRAYGGTGVTP